MGRRTNQKKKKKIKAPSKAAPVSKRGTMFAPAKCGDQQEKARRKGKEVRKK